MMIKRKIDGREIAIELTSREMYAAWKAVQNDNDVAIIKGMFDCDDATAAEAAKHFRELVDYDIGMDMVIGDYAERAYREVTGEDDEYEN